MICLTQMFPMDQATKILTQLTLFMNSCRKVMKRYVAIRIAHL